jgi:hypothetical protein
MSKRARDRRARTRRDDRYFEGRAKPEDLDAHEFGWNKAEIRSLWKWERQKSQLMFRKELEYENWLFFRIWKPLRKGKK